MDESEVRVRVTFVYYPEEPDPDHETGMTEDEFLRLSAEIGELGGNDLTCEKIS